MSKTIVFVRGEESSERTAVVNRVMKTLNPDLNTVRAIKLSLGDFIEHPNDKGAMKAADKSVKNIVKKVLVNHSETHIVIDNENLLPAHWQSFKRLGEECGIEFHTWGVEIGGIESGDPKKKNLQDANCAAFKCEVHKYIEANCEDLDRLTQDILAALKGEA